MAISFEEFRINAETKKEEKKVAIAGTDLNTNYAASSPEYKAFRKKVNQWQKDMRAYMLQEFNESWVGCFRFEVASGKFKPTTEGKDLRERLGDEFAPISEMMREMEENFLHDVLGK